MSTLIENVAKVEAANTAIGNAISSFGVTVPEGSRLSEKPALIGKIPRPGPSGWGRPANWPRIDMIDVRGEGRDVILLILIAPAFENRSTVKFNMTVGTSSGEWVMERIDVTEDGSISVISSSSFNSNSNGTFEFDPDIEPGTPIAIRIHTATWDSESPAHIVTAYIRGMQVQKSGMIAEAISRVPNGVPPYFGITSITRGPLHVAYWDSNVGGASTMFTTSMIGIEFLELHGGSYTFFNSWQAIGAARYCFIDDDVTLSFAENSTTASQNTLVNFIGNDIEGNCNWLGRITGFDRNVATKNLNNFAYLKTYLKSIDIPEGFGVDATNFNAVFYRCTSLETISLPTGFGQNATNASYCFYLCSALTNIIGEVKFPISFTLADSILLTRDSLMNVLNSIPTVDTNQTLTLGATNLAKLTDEERKVATDKGWTLA